MDLILTGRKMHADEAKHWGLVRDVVPADRLMDQAREITATIAQGAPLVAGALKESCGNTATHRLKKATPPWAAATCRSTSA